MAAEAKFSIGFESNAGAVSDEATAGLLRLRDGIRTGEESVKSMSASLRRLRGSSDEVKTAKDELRAKIAAEKSAITGAELALVKQGTSYEKLAAAAKKSASATAAASKEATTAGKKGDEAQGKTAGFGAGLEALSGPAGTASSKLGSLKGMLGEAGTGAAAAGLAIGAVIGVLFALGGAALSAAEKLARFVYRRAGHEDALRPELVRVIAQESDAARRTLVLDEFVNAVRDARGLHAPAGWAELYTTLERDADEHVRDQALELAIAFGDAAAFPALKALVEERSLASERRARALDALVRGGDPRTAPVLLALLDEEALRAAALRGLAAFQDEATAGAVLSRYATLSSEERRDALATLCARARWARELLAAVGDGRVPKNELSAFQLRALRQLADPEIDRLLDLHVGLVRAADAGDDANREQQIARVRALLGQESTPDLPRGREVFERTCRQCHTLFGAGGALGPDLTGANRAEREYLLSNVLDPSGVVGGQAPGRSDLV